MTQQIDALQQIDAQITAIDAQMSALNFEFLSALQNPTGVTATGQTPVEIAVKVMDKTRGLMSDKAQFERRRALIAQWVTAEFAPRDFQSRVDQLAEIANRARQLVLEAQNAESQAKAARSRAESGRQQAMEQLRATGLSNDDLNRIHNEIGAAKQAR